MGHNYIWNNVVSGAWDSASVWTDQTGGQDPAVVPPGASDFVTIDQVSSGQTDMIAGGGAANSLTINGAANLSGAYTAGSLTTRPTRSR